MLACYASIAALPYVILTEARSASSFFCEELIRHGIICDFEFLAPKQGNASHLMRLCRRAHIPCSNPRSCVHGFLPRILDAYYSSCSASTSCGFKLFPSHLPIPMEKSLDILVQRARRVIVLERPNSTSQYASLAKAYETGDWGFAKPGYRDSNFRAKLSFDEFVERKSSVYATYRNALNVPLMNVNFEDATGQSSIERAVNLTVKFIRGRLQPRSRPASGCMGHVDTETYEELGCEKYVNG